MTQKKVLFVNDSKFVLDLNLLYFSILAAKKTGADAFTLFGGSDGLGDDAKLLQLGETQNQLVKSDFSRFSPLKPRLDSSSELSEQFFSFLVRHRFTHVILIGGANTASFAAVQSLRKSQFALLNEGGEPWQVSIGYFPKSLSESSELLPLNSFMLGQDSLVRHYSEFVKTFAKSLNGARDKLMLIPIPESNSGTLTVQIALDSVKSEVNGRFSPNIVLIPEQLKGELSMQILCDVIVGAKLVATLYHNRLSMILVSESLKNHCRDYDPNDNFIEQLSLGVQERFDELEFVGMKDSRVTCEYGIIHPSVDSIPVSHFDLAYCKKISNEGVESFLNGAEDLSFSCKELDDGQAALSSRAFPLELVEKQGEIPANLVNLSCFLAMYPHYIPFLSGRHLISGLWMPIIEEMMPHFKTRGFPRFQRAAKALGPISDRLKQAGRRY